MLAYAWTSMAVLEASGFTPTVRVRLDQADAASIADKTIQAVGSRTHNYVVLYQNPLLPGDPGTESGRVDRHSAGIGERIKEPRDLDLVEHDEGFRIADVWRPQVLKMYRAGVFPVAFAHDIHGVPLRIANYRNAAELMGWPKGPPWPDARGWSPWRDRLDALRWVRWSAVLRELWRVALHSPITDVYGDAMPVYGYADDAKGTAPSISSPAYWHHGGETPEDRNAHLVKCIGDLSRHSVDGRPVVLWLHEGSSDWVHTFNRTMMDHAASLRDAGANIVIGYFNPTGDYTSDHAGHAEFAKAFREVFSSA